MIIYIYALFQLYPWKQLHYNFEYEHVQRATYVMWKYKRLILEEKFQTELDI